MGYTPPVQYRYGVGGSSVVSWTVVVICLVLLSSERAFTQVNDTDLGSNTTTARAPPTCHIRTCTNDHAYITTSENISECEVCKKVGECCNQTDGYYINCSVIPTSLTLNCNISHEFNNCSCCHTQWNKQLAGRCKSDKWWCFVLVIIPITLFVIWIILRTRRRQRNRRPPPTLPAKDDLDIRPRSLNRRSKKGPSQHVPEMKPDGEIPLTSYHPIFQTPSASPRPHDLSPAGRPSKRLNKDEDDDGREGYLDMNGLNKARDTARQAAGAKYLTKPKISVTTPNTTPKAGKRPIGGGQHEPGPSRSPATTIDRSEVLSDYQNVDGIPSTPSGEMMFGSKKDSKPNYQNVRDKEMTSYINNKLKLNIVPSTPSTTEVSLNTLSYKPKSSSPALPRTMPKTPGNAPTRPGDGRNLYKQLEQPPDQRMSTSSDTYGGVGELEESSSPNSSLSPDQQDSRYRLAKVPALSPKSNLPHITKGHNRQPSDTLPRMMVQPASSMTDSSNQLSTSLPRHASATSISSIGHPKNRQPSAATPPPPAPHVVKVVPGYVNQRPPPASRR